MFWSKSGQSWGLQLASFSGILAFLILLGVSRLFIGETAFELQDPAANAFVSVSPMHPTPEEQLDEERNRNIWKRRATVLLNYL
jgi:hypothetical protein